MNIKHTIEALTLEEKASLCAGLNTWHTRPVERLHIPALSMADGPHGLRKQPGSGDFLGLNVSLPATCFPAACTTASSWNPELLRQIGTALGEECLQEQVSVLLGPGVNIKRNPLCGRNFEYFSEDPLLTGTLACAYIEGLQSQGVGASIKHFAANNQETRRMTVDALIDERALREIYLPAFEQAIKQTQPWTVMAAYNRLNGTYCSENTRLLTTILRQEWGFEGVVVTDWGACNDRVAGLLAGQDLEMPGGTMENARRLVEAVQHGMLDEALLDQTVERLLVLILRAQGSLRPAFRYDAAAHHHLAYQAAVQSAVLLKNEEQILPLAPSTKLTVIGSLAHKMRYQGSGSSLVNPTRLTQPLDVLAERGIQVTYAEGYSRLAEAVDEQLLSQACEVARTAETVVAFVGLTDLAESEGFDRIHMQLPANQQALLERLTAIHAHLIVVLCGGAPVEFPWIDRVKALLNMYLPGQAGGSAVVDLLFGVANPGGKLAETYPLRYADVASSRYFPGTGQTVEYRESLFVGYRYFDTARQPVLFPFGHGLSYTTFAYEHLHLSSPTLTDDDTLQVLVTITNTGARAGTEIVQLYIHEVSPSVVKADKELKGFQKVLLQPDESSSLTFTLNRRDFAFYHVETGDWVVAGGEYELLIGASSRDIRLRGSVFFHSSSQPEGSVPSEAVTEYLHLEQNKGNISARAFASLYGHDCGAPTSSPGKPYTVNSTLTDIKGTLVGRLLYKAMINAGVRTIVDSDPERQLVSRLMIRQTLAHVPFRALAGSSGGIFTYGMAEGLAMLANGQLFRGSRQILRSLPRRKPPR
jgi:beta-glucosidase